jgi:hypothetical protein
LSVCVAGDELLGSASPGVVGGDDLVQRPAVVEWDRFDAVVLVAQLERCDLGAERADEEEDAAWCDGRRFQPLSSRTVCSLPAVDALRGCAR